MSLKGYWGPGSQMQFLALNWSPGALQGHFFETPSGTTFLQICLKIMLSSSADVRSKIKNML
jgi:hypothetical protein